MPDAFDRCNQKLDHAIRLANECVRLAHENERAVIHSAASTIATVLICFVLEFIAILSGLIWTLHK